MTQKELSYVEDAIGHEDNIIKICKDVVNRLEDEDLITFIEKEIDIHTNMKDELINKLEEKTNE